MHRGSCLRAEAGRCLLFISLRYEVARARADLQDSHILAATASGGKDRRSPQFVHGAVDPWQLQSP